MCLSASDLIVPAGARENGDPSELKSRSRSLCESPLIESDYNDSTQQIAGEKLVCVSAQVFVCAADVQNKPSCSLYLHIGCSVERVGG